MIERKKKVCTVCKIEKPLQQFYTFKAKNGTIRHYNQCRKCKNNLQASNQVKKSPALIILDKEYGVRNPSPSMIKQIENVIKSRKELHYFIKKNEA